MNYNPNQVATSIFVDQLASLGVEHAIIGAGSRSTPLTLAFTQHKSFQCYSQVDERSAGFFALGIAQRTGSPVVLVCTSGTAAANFFPAVIEANASGHSLIVCTADRPHDLRISGANQTMDQIKLYGDHVRWFSDIAIPRDDPTENIRYMRNLAALTYERSIFPVPGPVHLNFPFAKPLEPGPEHDQIISPENIVANVDSSSRTISVHPGVISCTELQIHQFNDLVNSANRVMLLCGPNADRYVPIQTVLSFLNQSGGIALIDPLSGYRYQSSTSDSFVTAYETFLQADIDLPSPDIIIHIGDMPISKYLIQWLKQYVGDWLLLNSHDRNTDGALNSTHRFKCDANQLLQTYQSSNETGFNEFTKSWIEIQSKALLSINNQLNELSSTEPAIFSSLFEFLPRSNLFVANSLIPRHLDQFVHDSSKDIHVYSNRGVSGIDGTLSTALGIASQSDRPTVLLTGDLAFYHDLNGLLAMMRYNIPLKVIIINNQAGAIFDRLPVSSFDPPFDEFFLTSHQLNFDQISKQYGITHMRVDPKEDQHIDWEIFNESSQIIVEILTEAKSVEQARDEIMNSFMQELEKSKN